MPALELVAEPAEPLKLRAFDAAHLAGDALLARGQNVAQLEPREEARTRPCSRHVCLRSSSFSAVGAGASGPDGTPRLGRTTRPPRTAKRGSRSTGGATCSGAPSSPSLRPARSCLVEETRLKAQGATLNIGFEQVA